MKENILAHALFLNGTDEGEIKLQFKLLQWMLANLQTGQDLDEDEFALAVEAVAAGRPVSVNYADRKSVV